MRCKADGGRPWIVTWWSDGASKALLSHWTPDRAGVNATGMKDDFDFVVIGGGSAGYAAARTAVSQGLSTAVIDGAETLGGLCILRGCMPSKALIESGNRNLSIRRASEFGLQASAAGVDVKAIRDRKRVLIDDFASYRQGQLQDGRFTLVRGRAQFTGTHEVKVALRDGGEQSIGFKTACIATGSSVQMLPVPGLAEAGFWTSDDILDADSLPASFIVIGGGAIALEMAHYLEAIGRRVTIVQRSAGLLSTLDPECGEVVMEAFRKRGMTVLTDTKMLAVTKTAEGKCITIEHEGQTIQAEAEEILVAAGRVPLIEALGLGDAGIESLNKKIAVQPTMQTTLPHVFAAGDVCSALDVVHIAIQQGEIAAMNAAALIKGEAVNREMDYRMTLFGVFCHPQVAGVGATEASLKKAGVPYLAASYPFNDHGKSMVMGETEGFVKLLTHKHTGEILGGSVVGTEATELIHEVVVAMSFCSTARQLALIPHYHPTLSEIWTYPAEELADAVD